MAGVTYLPDWTSDIDGAPNLLAGGGLTEIDGKYHAPVYQIKGDGSDADPFKAYRWGYVCPQECDDYASLQEAVLNIIRKKDEQPPQVEGQDPIIFENAEKAEDYIIAYVYFPENVHGSGCYEGVRREYYNGSPCNWEEELQLSTYEVFFYVDDTFVGFPDWDIEEEFVLGSESESDDEGNGITILPDWTSDIDGAPNLCDGGGMDYIDGKPHLHAPVYQIKGDGSAAHPFKAYRWGYVCPEECDDYASFLEAVLNIIRKKDEQPPQVEGQAPIIFENAEKAEDYIIAYVHFPENLDDCGCWEGMRRVEYYNNGGPLDWDYLQDWTYEVFFYVEGTFKGFPDVDDDEKFKYIGPE